MWDVAVWDNSTFTKESTSDKVLNYLKSKVYPVLKKVLKFVLAISVVGLLCLSIIVASLYN
jgi:hypothetical protein